MCRPRGRYQHEDTPEKVDISSLSGYTAKSRKYYENIKKLEAPKYCRTGYIIYIVLRLDIQLETDIPLIMILQSIHSNHCQRCVVKQ